MGLFSRIREWFRRRGEGKKEQSIPIYRREEPEPTEVAVEKPVEKPIIPKKKITVKTEEKPVTIKKSVKKAALTSIPKPVFKEPIQEKVVVEKPVVEKPISVTAEIQPEAKSEARFLKKEYEDLSKEKNQLRKDMDELDKQYFIGELTAMQRDQKFREKMVKAAYIAQRLYEIKSKTAELGIPIE